MRELTTDVAIIGAGTAGLNARREVERAGKRWLLIESAGYGTTCARVGCMPSKLLIAAAESAEHARRANLFGVRIDPAAIRVDGRAVLERVRRERDRFVRLVREEVERLPEAQRLFGHARFKGPTELVVGDHTRVRSKAVVIATGSRPSLPEKLAALDDPELVLTSDTIFELLELPESLAVFGTGAIGLELGQALQSLGVRVVFFNPNQTLGSVSDPEIDKQLRVHLRARLELELGVSEMRLERSGYGVVLHYSTENGVRAETRFARVLAASGRKPNLDALGLEHTGLALDEHGTPKFDPATMQCGSAPIFLAGDADGQRQVLHEAVDDGAIAGANAANFPQVEAMQRRAALSIAFTSPRVAVLGQSYREASQRPIAIGESSYSDQGRARVIAEAHGHVRVYVERGQQRLIGAELFGPGVEHTAHLLAWAVQAELPLRALLRMPVYHPTLEEGIRTALRDAAKKLELLQGCPPTDQGTSAGV